MKSPITRTLAAASLLLILLVTLSGCQNTAPTKPSHGQEEAIPGSGMPNYNDGSA